MRHIKGKRILSLWVSILLLICALLGNQQALAASNTTPWSYTGYWYGTTIPSKFFLDHATSKTVDFEFSMSPFGGEGQAHIHGDSAAATASTYYVKNYHVVFTQLSNGRLQVKYQQSGDPKSQIVEEYVENPFDGVTLSVPHKDTALFTGKTEFAPGTVLELYVAEDEDIGRPGVSGTNWICWEATVGPNGQIRSQNDISWLKGGDSFVDGYVTEVSVDNWFTTIDSIKTNTVETTIDHRDIAKDARRWYQPGTPAYAVADWVHTHPTVRLGRQWDGAIIELQGIGIYHLTYTSTTTAMANTRLQIGASPGDTVTPKQVLIYYTFKLTKKNGVWHVDAQDLPTMIYREGNPNINWTGGRWY